MSEKHSNDNCHEDDLPEQIGVCEGCRKIIREGDQHHPCSDDDIVLCFECAPPACLFGEVMRCLQDGADALESIQWKPISEASVKYKDGKDVVLLWGGKVVVGYYLDNSGSSIPWEGWRVPSGRCTPSGPPTHFMPLPPAPQEGE